MSTINPRSPLLLLILLVTIGGCGILDPDDSSNKPSSGVIMPLKVGNTWIGRTTMTDRDGAVTSVTYDTLRIVKEKRIDGYIWYEANTGDLYRNDADGLHVATGGGMECTCPVVKYPAARLDTFNTVFVPLLFPDYPEAILTSNFTQVASRDTAITVPPGTFTCYHYRRRVESTDPSKPVDAVVIREHEFYAPNIGPVKREGHDGSRWEVVKYEL